MGLDEALEAPEALTVSPKEELGALHGVSLLSGGQRLDAVGSVSGVRSRASVSGFRDACEEGSGLDGCRRVQTKEGGSHVSA